MNVVTNITADNLLKAPASVDSDAIFHAVLSDVRRICEPRVSMAFDPFGCRLAAQYSAVDSPTSRRRSTIALVI